jgi:hypothetical protein
MNSRLLRLLRTPVFRCGTGGTARTWMVGSAEIPTPVSTFGHLGLHRSDWRNGSSSRAEAGILERHVLVDFHDRQGNADLRQVQDILPGQRRCVERDVTLLPVQNK